MNPNLLNILEKANRTFNFSGRLVPYLGQVHVGVDLGTAYSVMVVLDDQFQPLAGRYQFAEIVRDGLVVDFIGAIQLVKKMKGELEEQLGFPLVRAATTYPPGVPMAEVKATRNVLIGAGLECSAFLDEPTAANALLQVENGAVVDVGGGTTGIAIIENGKVIYTADEPTGGTHFTLVISGALNLPFLEAERFKTQSKNSQQVQTLVYPVMQKVGSIIEKHIASFHVPCIYLVGGSSSLQSLAEVVEDFTGVPTYTPPYPMFVTPIGVAMNDL
ncbi:MAG: ethanolamine utilization protein EutJ [Chloroflexota bacterium]